MKSKNSQHRQYYFLGIIFLISLLSRIWQLKLIPISLHPDERVYAANAQSLIASGLGLDGKWKFWQLKPLTTMHAELPTAVMALGFLLTDNTALAPKLVSVFFSLTLPLILAVINQDLFNRKNIFLITFFIASFNPWIWQFGRMGFDVLYGLWFYFLAILVIRKASGWGKLFSLPLILVGFYQYQGFKVILVPVLLGVISYQLWLTYKRHKITRRLSYIYAFIAGFILTLFGYYLLIQLPSQSAEGRLTQGSIISRDYLDLLGGSANLERNRSITSPLLSLASNKLTILAKKQWSQFFKIFNPQHLFLSNDAAFSPFSVWSKGLFYLVDLLIIAIFVIIDRKTPLDEKRSLRLLSWLFLVGSWPAFINISNDWFTNRAAFSFVIIILLVGYFATIIYQYHRKIFVALTIFYLMGVVSFTYDYFYRYPIYAADGLYFNEKILAEYLARSKNKQVSIYSNRAEDYLMSYLYYSQQISTPNIEDIQRAFATQHHYRYQQILFTDAGCVPPIKNQELVIRDVDIQFCQPETQPHLSISSLVDSGEISKIYGDTLCSPYQKEMRQYLRLSSLERIDFSSLSDEEFCRQWITDLSDL